VTSPTEQAPGSILDPAERAARFQEGPPKLSRRVVWFVIGAVAVLGIGGAFADHSFNVTSQTPTTTAVTKDRSVARTLSQYVGLRVLSNRAAPALELVDQHGVPFHLASLSGRVTVLTFLDPRCTDICPVVSAELRQAASDLGRGASTTAFVVVDANPSDLGRAAASAGIRADHLGSLPDLYFLSGSLPELNKVWVRYDVTIDYDPTTRRLAHTNIIYVISRSGRLTYSLAPFGNESFSGGFSLSLAETQRFASGLAHYVGAASR
jgi:cytochrome oxidase Cu insertion factor (SCO1/SenC/PrrC family)